MLRAWLKSVFFQFSDGGSVATQGAAGGTGEVDALPVHSDGVEGEQGVGERLTDADDNLDALGGLYSAEHTGNAAEYTDGGACLYVRDSWRFGEQAAVAGRTWYVRHDLTRVSADATHAERFAEHDAGIID